MIIPGRRYTAGNGYRYGFNGKENDNDVKGEGNQQDYGMRIYDPRLGRFLSVDPISKNYPELTPYQFASNRPIDGIDLDGLEYLNAVFSKISISFQLMTYHNKTVLSGTVYLNSDKVSSNTRDYINSQNSGANQSSCNCIGSSASTIATFKHKAYDELSKGYIKDATSLLEQPTMEDAEAESLKQQEIQIPRMPNDKTEEREIRRSKEFSVPSGIATGTVKGDAIIAAVVVATKIIEVMHGTRIGNDFEEGRNQVEAATKAINDVQFGIDNNLLSNDVLNNLNAFGNYLLDGREPTHMVSVKLNNGKVSEVERTDDKTLNQFKDAKNKIIQKKVEQNNN